jgi:hypothetical protein
MRKLTVIDDGGFTCANVPETAAAVNPFHDILSMTRLFAGLLRPDR